MARQTAGYKIQRYKTYLQVQDSGYIYFGDGKDASLYADGTGVKLTGALDIVGDITLEGDITLSTEDVSVAQGKYLYLEGQAGASYIRSDTAGDLMLNTTTNINFAFGGTDEVRLTATVFSPAVSGGNALGSTSLMWNGLCLANGTAINWNNSDVTLTHSSGALTVSGYDKIQFNDTTTFIHANQDGSLWLQGNNAEYGIYLVATGSSVNISGYLKLASIATDATSYGCLWYKDGEIKYRRTSPNATRTFAALEEAQTYTAAITMGTTNAINFTDTDAFIYANQAGSVWIQGASAEYGIYLNAPNSEVRISNVLRFTARSAVYVGLGALWFDSDDSKFHYYTTGEYIILATDANGVLGQALTIGTSGVGHDVTFNCDTANYRVLFDAEGDGNKGSLEIGQDTYGIDLKCFGQTAGASLTWDASANALEFSGNSLIVMDCTSTGAARYTLQQNTLTISSNHTGQSVTALRLYTQTTDGTPRTVGNMYGARIETNIKDAADTIAGLVAGTQIIVDLNDWNAGVSPANVTGLDIVHQETGTRATAPMSFIAMNDNDYAGACPVAYLFDVGGLIGEVGTGSGKIYHNNTLKIKASTADRFIPLSTVEGTYTTAYPVALSYAGIALQLTGTATIAIGSTGTPVTTATTSEKWLEVYANTTATSGTHSCLYAISDSSGDGSCSARTIEGWLTISGDITGSNAQPAALYSRLTLTGEVNSASAFIQSADIRMEDGSPTQTLTAFDECSVAIIQSMINTSDISAMHSQILRLANNGTANWRAFVACHGNELVDYLFRFSGCGGATPMLGVGNLMQHGGKSYVIKCRSEDTSEDFYILGSTAPTLV